MPITKLNDLISQVGSQIWLSQPIWGEIQTATASIFLGNNFNSMQKVGVTKALPNPLPSGVTNYIATGLSIASSDNNVTVLIGKLINLGNLVLSTNTFTDGSTMPTVTELGSSVVTYSPVLAEVSNASGLNATPGSVQITYVDQSGNAAESNTAQTMVASSAVHSVGWAILNTGDYGVQDITSAAQSGGASPTGTITFWGVIPLSMIIILAAGTNDADNLISMGFNPVRLGAGDVIGCFTATNSVSTKAVLGNIFFVGDN